MSVKVSAALFTWGRQHIIVAESFVTMPFFVITVESGLRSVNRRLEDAARSLGAGRRTVFLRVTLPLAIYISQNSNRTDQAIALSLILVLVSLVVMIFRRDRYIRPPSTHEASTPEKPDKPDA
jgi:ABC-type Fe3+ transport system permease subunit